MTTDQSVEYDAITDLISEITSWVIDCELYEVDHDTVTFGGQHNYGIAFWTENSSLEETCQANGIAYHIQDEGKYEIEGESRSWKPGAPERRRSVLSGGAIALNKMTAQNMWDQALPPTPDARLAGFARVVLDYFEIQATIGG